MEAKSWALTLGSGEVFGDRPEQYQRKGASQFLRLRNGNHLPAYLRVRQCGPHEPTGKPESTTNVNHLFLFMTQ